jgi:hypothetical protein
MEYSRVVDLVCNFTELSLKPSGHKREVVQVILGRENKNEYRHDIIKFEQTIGSCEYVLDLTGAQFGHYEPLIPWHEYVITRVGYFEADAGNRYFGGRKAELEELSGVQNAMGAIFTINKSTSRELRRVINEWEKENSLTVREMFKLPEGNFKEKQQKLVDRIGLELELFLARARDIFAKSDTDPTNA